MIWALLEALYNKGNNIDLLKLYLNLGKDVMIYLGIC